MAFSIEILLFLVFPPAASLGLPLGVPPGEEVPALSAVAPQECLFYTSWSPPSEIDSQRSKTEQWMGREPIARSAQRLERVVCQWVMDNVAADDPTTDQLAAWASRFSRIALRRGTAVFIEQAESVEKLTGGIVMHLEPDVANRLVGEFAALQAQLPESYKPRRFQVGESDYHAMTIGLGAVAVEMAVAVRGPLAIVAVGAGSAEGIERRLGTPEPAWLTQMKNDLGVERRASMSYLRVDALDRLLHNVVRALPRDEFAPADEMLEGIEVEELPREEERVLQFLRLDAIESLQSVSGLEPEGFVCRHRLVAARPFQGLLASLDIEPMDAFQLSGMPGQPDLAFGIKFSLERLFESLREVEPDMTDEMLGEIDENFQETFGVRLREDLLQYCDDAFYFSSTIEPADPFSGWMLQLGIRDEMAFSESLHQLTERIEKIAEESSGELTFERREVEGVEIYHVETAIPFGPTVHPTWSLFDGRVCLTLDPATLEKFIRQPVQGRLVNEGLVRDWLDRAQHDSGGQPLGISYVQASKLIQLAYDFSSIFRNPELPFDIDDLPSAKVLCEGLDPIVSVLLKTDAGLELIQRQTVPGGTPGATAAGAALVAAPVLFGAGTQSEQVEVMNQLKQLSLAAHNYHDAFGSLPPSYSVSREGRPLLSWRVHVLPFLEEQALYQQFHLDEPWDSPHNRTLIEKMPRCYDLPKLDLPPGSTPFLACRGIDSPFTVPAADKPMIGQSLESIANGDGAFQTVMLVLANGDSAVTWTRPDDLEAADPDAIDHVRGAWPRRILFACCDASVRAIPDDIRADQWREMIGFRDGKHHEFESSTWRNEPSRPIPADPFDFGSADR